MLDPDRYHEAGYLLCRGFLPAPAVARVHEDAKEVFAIQMRRLGLVDSGEISAEEHSAGMFRLFETDVATFINCGKQAQHLISLHRLSLDRKIEDALHELGLTNVSISTRPVLYFNHPRLAQREVYWRLSLHQDWRSMQGSLDSVVAWLPLVDIDEDLGALEVIPGSHRWGLLPADLIDGYGLIDPDVAREHDLSGVKPVEVRVGDALLFSSLLVHRSGTNVTEDIRWSCHFRYNNLDESTFVARGFPHPYIYRPQEGLITSGFPQQHHVDQTFRRTGRE